MRSPQDMHIIQIDITNACVHRCANCTRFCGHHRHNFFMSFATFKQALDSLSDFPGTVGIIGGEPTLHPEFERFLDYIRLQRTHRIMTNSRLPISDMQSHFWQQLYRPQALVGLWSSLTTQYYKHFETISDTFDTQLLNDHQNLCQHQALLMSRRELGIPDDEWLQKRNNCWIQNQWSATITPKGAFFCEVAGALDMLFDGDGGWPIEPGWWRRQPSDFGKQLEWCELCSACLDVPKRISNDERDDVTPNILERLKKLGSPKALSGKCVVHDPADYESYREASFSDGNDYMASGGNVRTTKANRNLYPKDVVFVENDSLVEALKKKPTDWIALGDNPNKQIIGQLTNEYILNPGCCYIIGDTILFNVLARSIRDKIPWPKLLGKNISMYYPADKVITINVR